MCVFASAGKEEAGRPNLEVWVTDPKAEKVAELIQKKQKGWYERERE